MPFGFGEILLVGVLLFVVFGPRKKGARKDTVGRWLLKVLAVLAPALLMMDRAGAMLKLAATHRLLLVGASAAATGLSVVILAWINRDGRDGRDGRAKGNRGRSQEERERRDGGGRDVVQRR